jgi:hypothetical protein
MSEDPAAQPQSPSGPPEGDPLYAVPYPPAMYARDILNNRAFAAAMGYDWLHDEDTEFVRAFRDQVRRQAELYESWLEAE